MPEPEWLPHWETILDGIASGQTLVAVCKPLKIRPENVLMGVRRSPERGEEYARARECGAEIWASGVLSEADQEPRLVPNKHGELVVDAGWVQLQRLRVDSRKWLASKVLPRQYGDKVDVTSGGEKVQGVVMLPPDRTTTPRE